MSTDATIYLDCAATTPLDPEVLEAMLPILREGFGNPSGAYGVGRHARTRLEAARAEVAGLLGGRPDEIVFTSGGTESDNLAVRGAALAARDAGRGAHLVTTAVEHVAVLDTARQLEDRFGFECTVVGVDGHGLVDPGRVLDAVRPDTVLVSVMTANNEVGTVEPVAEIGAELRERGVLFHTDAVQAACWKPLDVEALGVDLLSLSAHKFHGPKGVGLLYVRDGTPLLIGASGGGQEGGRRGGTENVAGAVGLATALRLVRDRMADAVPRVAGLRDRLVAGLADLGGVWLTGHPERRLPNHASVCVDGAPADVMLLGLDMHGLCASSGSACATGDHHASHVLSAMGVPGERARGALRFSLCHSTTGADVDTALDVVRTLVEGLRTGASRH